LVIELYIKSSVDRGSRTTWYATVITTISANGGNTDTSSSWVAYREGLVSSCVVEGVDLCKTLCGEKEEGEEECIKGEFSCSAAK
jgi:hypothetical protein